MVNALGRVVDDLVGEPLTFFKKKIFQGLVDDLMGEPLTFFY
jgi:hypothetical protein